MERYRLDISEVYGQAGSGEKGLTAAEAAARLTHFGPNRVSDEDRISRLRILAGQFTSPLIYILLIAAVVTALLEEYVDSGVILTVVVLNAAIGFFQEYRARKASGR